MKDQRLNPCRTCLDRWGNEGVVELFHMTESDHGGYYPAKVRCYQCKTERCGDKTDESAIVAWNKANA
jgi:hypothetical protein